MYGYEWTEEYGIFRLTINEKVPKEIRPVFHEELDFFGLDAYWDYPKDTEAPLLWAEGITVERCVSSTLPDGGAPATQAHRHPSACMK